MYAYAEDGFGVSLNHLTGVLKIGVTGSAKVVLAQISNANRKPIAGAFDFDFEKGEATATATSKELIEYSFGEGVQLSSEPTYIHAVVPAGEYDELYVTLYDEDGGVMYATVKANEEKPLAAGKVREFSNSINYSPDASVFIVRDVASLRAFADAAATLDKDVLFVADVDMTGEEWTPIDGYAGTVRGNGYAIKGLTAPLFHITNASIKGLHLKDVNIVSNDVVVMGALVCNATATETIKPVIENCSVSGSFTVENKTYAPTTKDLKTALFYGGLVGISNGVDLKDCVNYASITVKQSIKKQNLNQCRILCFCCPLCIFTVFSDLIKSMVQFFLHISHFMFNLRDPSALLRYRSAYNLQWFTGILFCRADAVVNADNLPNQQKNTNHCHPCDVLHYLSPLSAFLNWYPKKKLMHMV